MASQGSCPELLRRDRTLSKRSVQEEPQYAERKSRDRSANEKENEKKKFDRTKNKNFDNNSSTTKEHKEE